MAEQPDKKIIVDEDWKSQVEKERQAEEQPKEPTTDSPQHGELPPADLIYLASTLYFQALVALGLVPHPASNKPERDLVHARHTIDTLEMLWSKTEGNRTDEESGAIEEMLHELRMTFVSLDK